MSVPDAPPQVSEHPLAGTPYPVIFSETGLPAGTNWSVTLNGTTRSSVGPAIQFFEINGTYSFAIGVVVGFSATPQSGNVTVNGGPVSRAITFKALYVVTFTAAQLRGGTSWTVVLGGVRGTSSTSTILFTEPNGTYAFTVSAVPGYLVTPASGSIAVAGGPVGQTITFHATYSVTFQESGLPAGTNWSVTFNGSLRWTITTSISFVATNGSFPYAIGAPPGYTTSPSPGTGSVTVSGSNVTQPVAFSAFRFSVTFNESGLPPGTLWSVVVAGNPSSSTSASITVLEPNGTYAFRVGSVPGYSASLSGGTVTVNGASVYRSIAFVTFNWSVTFTETGLPSGSGWLVTLSGASHATTTNSIVFAEPNGTYAFSIAPISGYRVVPPSGSITVSGGPAMQTIRFIAVFTVTFTETGLPTSTSWSVTLNGTLLTSTSAQIVFPEISGTYSFTVGTVAGYGSNPSAGTLSVSGSSVTRTIAFSPASTPPSGGSTPTFLGLPVWESAPLIAIAALVAALLLASLFSCPDECTPEGKKTGCSAHVYLDLEPCGTPASWSKDVKVGAEIMTLGVDFAKKLEVVGEAYAAVLEKMPGWVDAADQVMKNKVGTSVYATVVCRWKACRIVRCIPWFWVKHLVWVEEGKAYGPYPLKPPSGMGWGSGDECFKVGLSIQDLYNGIKSAIDSNKDIAEAREKCKKECE